MAIKYLSNGLMLGLESDTKPVLPADGLMFIEEDAGKIFLITAGVWAELINPSYATGGGTATGTNTGDQTSIVGITGTTAQFNTALSDANFATGGGTASGTNTGDQTSIVGITGTIAQFNTAISDGDLATGGGTATGTNTGDQTSIVGITGTLAQFNTALTGADFSTGGGTATGTNTGDQTLPVKATGAEVNTGTDDAKFVTAKAVADSTILRSNLTGNVTSVGVATTIAAGVVTEAMQVLADNTTQDVSITKHGYVPKAPNVATQFLNGTGAFSTPAGGSGISLGLAVATIGGLNLS